MRDVQIVQFPSTENWRPVIKETIRYLERRGEAEQLPFVVLKAARHRVLALGRDPATYLAFTWLANTTLWRSAPRQSDDIPITIRRFEPDAPLLAVVAAAGSDLNRVLAGCHQSGVVRELARLAAQRTLAEVGRPAEVPLIKARVADLHRQMDIEHHAHAQAFARLATVFVGQLMGLLLRYFVDIAVTYAPLQDPEDPFQARRTVTLLRLVEGWAQQTAEGLADEAAVWYRTTLSELEEGPGPEEARACTARLCRRFYALSGAEATV